MTSILRAALLGLTAIATSCQSATRFCAGAGLDQPTDAPGGSRWRGNG